MNAKLLRYTIYTTVLPVSGVLWAVVLKDDGGRALACLSLLAALQLTLLMLCRRSLDSIIHPDTAVLQKMGVEYVPIAYQPGRFKADARVSFALNYLSLLPPALIWLACQFPERTEVSVVPGLSYTSPNMALMMAALFTLLIGAAALPFWFHAARAAVIYNTGSEQKRYLLRGFADLLEQREGLYVYQNACKGIFHLPGMEEINGCYWVTHQ